MNFEALFVIALMNHDKPAMPYYDGGGQPMPAAKRTQSRAQGESSAVLATFNFLR